MKTLRIAELENQVAAAKTQTVEGRSIVVNALKEFYNLIEEDVYNAGSEWMLQGMYQDLCQGNFAEPFMCERKKTDFLTVKKVYEERILPRI